MDAFEFNKIAAGIIAPLLALQLFFWGGDIIYGSYGGSHDEHHLAFSVEVGGQDDAEVEVVDEGPSIDELLLTADISSGETLFARNCASCHSIAPGQNMTGPGMHGVVGRDIGGYAGFAYSDILMEIEGEWTPEALNGFIQNPRGWAPGTRMGYSGMRRDTDRADLIAYLATLAE